MEQQQPPKAEGAKPQKQPKEKKSVEKKEKVDVTKLPKPDFTVHRVAVWDTLKKRQDEEYKAKEHPIKVTLPNGSQVDAIAWKTTPLDIAAGISKSLAEASVVAKVNGNLWDLGRVLESDCALELIKFDAEEGKSVFWHSSSHMLGQAMEYVYKCNLTTGPPLKEGGFYYDAEMKSAVTQEDFEPLNELVNKIASEKQPFERLVVKKSDALELFKYNKYKYEILKEKVPEDGTCTVYRCGNLIDPCRGPHIPNTGRVKGFKVVKNSSSYWKGDAKNDALQRVYGMSFPSKDQLKEWEKIQEEIAKRDHRNIGKQQELFFFHPLSPGSCFFLPHGARLYNKLIEFIRSEYRNRGFTEVVTPNVFSNELWKTSGHWENYKDNMFTFKCEDTEFAMKPMNCPGHCLMFGHRIRSYRELPIRFADFGVLHRNEYSGALTGLTRVRRFQQDDAHIFCMPEQIKSEITGALEFLQSVYGRFGFEYSLELSTRPEKYLGELSLWNKAEAQLAAVLDEFKATSGKTWKLNPGDGAFYGPKIDIHIKDALGRSHQCATIQLDFQLPIRFNLEYVSDHQAADSDANNSNNNNNSIPSTPAANNSSNANNSADSETASTTSIASSNAPSLGHVIHRPVIIHRAILGSVERFMANLIEHTGGKWPFWISPRQIIVCPVSDKYNEYAEHVKNVFHQAGFYIDADLSDKSLNKKIRESQLSQYNFILVVGEKEKETNSVAIRTRDDNQVIGVKTLQETMEMLGGLVKEFK